MIALLAAGALAWDLQSPFNKETTAKYSVTAKADVGGEQHEATFVFTIVSSKASGESVPVKMSWSDLLVDGQGVGDPGEWPGQLDKFGQLTKLEGDDDNYRRMLAPFMFSYPNKSVEEKAKFESTWMKSDHPQALTFSGEAGAVDKDLLKVTSKLVEKGEQGIRADGTWWFDSKGKLARFELDVKNWVVPMAGPEAVSAKVTGIAK